MLACDVARRSPNAADFEMIDALKRGVFPSDPRPSDASAADAAAASASISVGAYVPAPAIAATALPPSRIPANFHVRDESGRLIFPSEQPAGDSEVGLLADTLGGMLEEWRSRLDANKPSFPLGAARWGVLQMCIYDMWCTIEEARIWDIGLTETERLAHYYSPQLAAMVGRLRVRLSQAFATTLSMSQRMQFELQRWHTQWVEQSAQLKQEETQRQSLQQRCTQLQERVTSLEEERTLYQARGGDAHPLEKAFQKLQDERIKLSQQLRAANARNTSVRTSNLTLRLSNEGLLEELSRWRASLGDDPSQMLPGGAASQAGQGADKALHPEDNVGKGKAADGSRSGTGDGAAGGDEGSVDMQPLLELFASYPADTQRIALDAILRVNEALTGETYARGGAQPPPVADAAGEGPRVPTLPSTAAAGASGSAVRASKEERQAALDQLAHTLSEDEAQFLIRQIATRRAAAEAGTPGGFVGDMAAADAAADAEVAAAIE